MRFIGAAAIVVVVWLAYEEISVHLPRTVKATSRSHTVTGRYSFVDLDLVDGLAIEGRDVVVRGYRIRHFLGPKFETESATVVKRLPDVATNRPSRGWSLMSDTYAKDSHVFTFIDVTTQGVFSMQLPEGSGKLYFAVRDVDSGRELMVFAAGEWKVGPPSYYGYVTIARR